MNLTKAGLQDSFRSLIRSEVRLLLSKVDNFLAERNIESYVVGGFVRDVLLGRDTADIDLAVAQDALNIAPEVATALGGKYVLLDRVNRVGRVILVDKEATSPKFQLELDFSTFTGSIEQDLARRDFTIDAMAVNLSHFGKGFSDIQLIDPLNGLDDLRHGIIRVVAETVFASDAARLLRAVRLAAELGFSIDKKTEALIRHYSPLLTEVAGERVREELLRLLAVPGAGQFLTYLDELGLLAALFPELVETKGVEQPKEHFWNVFEHSLKTVVAVDFLLRRGVWEYANEEVLANVPWSAVLAQHFGQEVSSGSNRMLLLKLAALLHDISKPQTKTLDAGRMRFLGHAKEGAVIAANMLERLRFSSKEVKLVETEINYHLRPVQMSQEGLPTHRAIYRYFRDAGEAGIDILFLSLADHLATRGPNLDLASFKEHARLVDYVIGQHFEQENIVHPSKLVDGYDIINIFSMSPGPEVGELLEAVREAQASGEVTTREQALSFIKEVLASSRE
jgi:poly(A) polymerase